MSEIKASKRNNWSTLADILKAAKEKANQYAVYDSVPLIGGTGIGDMILGESPELVDDMSYYGLDALRSGGNVATGGIGTLAPDKRTLDLAMLGVDALGAGKAAMYGGKSASKAAIDAATKGTMNPMRRQFMKGAAATAGVAAIGGLSGLRKAGKDVAKHSADNVTKAATKHRFNSLKEYNDYLNDKADTLVSERINEIDYNMPERDREMLAEDFLPVQKQKLAKEEEALYQASKEQINTYGGGSPSQYEIIERFSPQAKQEMKQFKRNMINREAERGLLDPNFNPLDYLDEIE